MTLGFPDRLKSLSIGPFQPNTGNGKNLLQMDERKKPSQWRTLNPTVQCKNSQFAPF